MFGAFLFLNLFVGVVVQTFNREKNLLGKNFLLTENQKKWLEQKRLVMKISPKVVIDTHNNVIREFIRRLVLSNGFDSFITYCIILNTIVLAIDWYSMPSYIDDT